MVDFAVPAYNRVKVKNGEKLDKYLEFDNLWNMNVTMIGILVGDPWGSSRKPGKGIRWIKDRKKIRNYPDDNITKIGLDTRRLERFLLSFRI